MRVRPAACRWTIAAAVTVLALAARAHHGNLVSFELDKRWTRAAVVAEFAYVNPHPRIAFDLQRDGRPERWVADLLSTPGSLARNGWSKTRTLDALRPGAVIEVTVAPSKLDDRSGNDPMGGARSGLVLRIAAGGTEIATDGVPLVFGSRGSTAR